MNNDNLTAQPHLLLSTDGKYGFVLYEMSKLIFYMLHDVIMYETYHFPSVLFVRLSGIVDSGSSMSCSMHELQNFIPKTKNLWYKSKEKWKSEPLSTDNAGYV